METVGEGVTEPGSGVRKGISLEHLWCHKQPKFNPP